MSKRENARHLYTPQVNPVENELANAIIDREAARVSFEQHRTRLMKASRRVQDIKAKIHYGKEVCHG